MYLNHCENHSIAISRVIGPVEAIMAFWGSYLSNYIKQLWVSDFCGFILVIWWSNQCDVFLLAACCQFSQVQDVFLQAVQHNNLTFYAGYPSSCSSTCLSRLGTDTRRTLAHHDWVQHDHSLADRGHNPPSSFRLFGLPFLSINNKK